MKKICLIDLNMATLFNISKYDVKIMIELLNRLVIFDTGLLSFKNDYLEFKDFPGFQIPIDHNFRLMEDYKFFKNNFEKFEYSTNLFEIDAKELYIEVYYERQENDKELKDMENRDKLLYLQLKKKFEKNK